MLTLRGLIELLAPILGESEASRRVFAQYQALCLRLAADLPDSTRAAFLAQTLYHRDSTAAEILSHFGEGSQDPEPTLMLESSCRCTHPYSAHLEYYEPEEPTAAGEDFVLISSGLRCGRPGCACKHFESGSLKF